MLFSKLGHQTGLPWFSDKKLNSVGGVNIIVFMLHTFLENLAQAHIYLSYLPHLCSLEPFKINYFEYLWWLILYEISLLYIFYTRKVYVGGAWGYFCCCCCGSLFLSVPKLCQQYTAQLILKLLSTTFRGGTSTKSCVYPSQQKLTNFWMNIPPMH